MCEALHCMDVKPELLERLIDKSKVHLRCDASGRFLE